ncbi:hypothetical protein [Nostocoides sp. F2B08]|uniref:hypothetical protein n=1 Tax=Nostocoides sp. F2B08 TaxID=2653936 RepID=UPI001D056A62|nr:hypothetical protein [Tetrasphaera sp. F2B08]
MDDDLIAELAELVPLARSTNWNPCAREVGTTERRLGHGLFAGLLLQIRDSLLGFRLRLFDFARICT